MRQLTEQELSDFRTDGVAYLPAAVEREWVDSLLAVVDDCLENPGQWTNDGNPGADRDRMFTRRYMWPHNDIIRDYIFNSGCAALAGQAMGCDTVRFYFDHLLIKEPETRAATPWHQDIPYWPFKGSQVCSIWLALTETTVAESAMEFVRGSHLDGNYYRPEVFNARANHPNAWQEEAAGTPVPDIEGHRADFDIIGYDVQPGDALLFSAWTLHGAPGNASSSRRRAALSTRWLGDNATWYPHQGSDPIVGEEHVNLRPGDYPADDSVFPVVWQR
jgi:ectoine hydroxylase-related dioxygenase (phytanoyl-CoA dioxygenase family)